MAARAAERTKLIADTIQAATDTLAGNELSDVQKRMKDINDAATELGNALIYSGQAADEAGQAVNDKLIPALDKLRGSFIDDLVSKINDLSGGGWINDLTDLIKQVAQMKQDAASLGGVDPGLIDTFTVLSAQKIVDSAKLTGDAFITVQQQLGGLGSQLHEFSTAVGDTAGTVADAADVIKRSMEEIAQTIQSNEDRLFTALHRTDSLQDQLARFDLQAQREREAEIAAGGQALASLEAAQQQERINLETDFLTQQLKTQQDAQKASADAAKKAADDALAAQKKAAEEQQRVFDEAVKFIETATRRISDFISHYLSGSGSPLSPQQQLQTATSTFQQQLALAQGGDRDALTNITSSAQDALDAIKRYYGSSAQGAVLQDQILQQLGALPSQISPEQFIVNAIDDLSDTVETTVTGVDTSVDQLQAAVISALSGNTSTLSAILLDRFASLDTNVNGLLDFSEFQAGLAGMASVPALQTLFKTLDTDNSGSLSKLELIRAATADNLPTIKTSTQGTATSTGSIDTTNASIDTKSSTLSPINSNTANAATSLLALAQISNNTGTTATQAASTAANTGLASDAIGAGNLTSILNSVASNIGAISSWAPGSQHATGGIITGPGTGTSDSIPARLSAGEYVVNARATSQNRQLLDAVNYGRAPVSAGNDNSSIEIRALRSEVRDLKLALLRVGQGITDGQFAAVQGLREDLQETTKVAKARRFAA